MVVAKDKQRLMISLTETALGQLDVIRAYDKEWGIELTRSQEIEKLIAAEYRGDNLQKGQPNPYLKK